MSLVFFPLRFREMQLLPPEDHLDSLLERLPVVALTLAAAEIDIGAEPGEGEAGERATAEDSAQDAEAELSRAKEEVSRLIELTAEKERETQSVIESGADEAKRDQVRVALAELLEQARETEGRVQKARARARETVEAARAKGAKVGKEDEEPPE